MSRAFFEDETTRHVASRSKKQEGVVTLAHALAAGMSERQVEGMVERGEWRRSYRGVSSITAHPSPHCNP
jgi:hypothetical protein